MKPENIKLAEELDFSGPVSYLLNRVGKRVVGCSTQAVWNLITVLNGWVNDADPMDGLLTIRSGIKENFETQGANPQNIFSFIKSEPLLAEQLVDAFNPNDKSSTEIIRLLKNHVILVFTFGVEAFPDQGHVGLFHVTNGRLYMDGTELDIQAACRFLYSSNNNFIVVFER